MQSVPRPSTCALCCQEKPLRDSHVIPKFAVEWIKKGSPTGFLRRPEKINLRVQDAGTRRMLCSDCEELFSAWEKEFADHIFYPYLRDGQKEFQYEEWLLRFAISLAWRTVSVDLESIKGSKPALVADIEEAMRRWRDYLLGRSPDPGSYQHHLWFLDLVEIVEGRKLPKRFNAYLMAGADATVASGERESVAYTHLPGFIFVSCINPKNRPGWYGTQILSSGLITTKQRIEDASFFDFLMNRVELFNQLSNNLSERQQQKINEAMLRDVDKTLSSRSFEVLARDFLFRSAQQESER